MAIDITGKIITTAANQTILDAANVADVDFIKEHGDDIADIISSSIDTDKSNKQSIINKYLKKKIDIANNDIVKSITRIDEVQQSIPNVPDISPLEESIQNISTLSGVPIYTQDKIQSLSENLPSEYITIPNLSNEHTTDTTGSSYITTLFSAIRELQAEVTKIKNTFKYGLYSYTGSYTAMSNVVNDYSTASLNEPLWAVDETNLSEVTGAQMEISDNHTLTPIVNVKSDDGILKISDTALWQDTNTDTGYISCDDAKLFLYLTVSNLNISITLSELSNSNDTITINLSDIKNIPNSLSEKYNVMFVVSRTTESDDVYYGNNFIYISIANYGLSNTVREGYWYSDNVLHDDITIIGDATNKQLSRYTISKVSFTDVNLYHWGAYSKYQDFSNEVIPSTPSDDDYKYRVAHLTVRSVENYSILNSIKDQLPTNELIYNESLGTLWIKLKNGKLKELVGSSSQIDTGMEKQEIIEWLAANGIIVTENGTDNVSLQKIGDITFIHQATGDSYKFEVGADGQLHSTKLSDDSTTLDSRMKTISFELPTTTNIRGFVGLLRRAEKDVITGTTTNWQNDDLRLYADRIKIGAIYAPYEENQKGYGCSHGYIELENTSDTDFNLKGCYLHFAKGNGTAEDTTTYSLALTGMLPAGGTYLIRCKQYTDINAANCFIKVNTYDQEWYVTEDNDTHLLDLTLKSNNSFLLTYGELQNIQYVATNQDTATKSKSPNVYASSYIDSVSIGGHAPNNTSTQWCVPNSSIYFTIGATTPKVDCIYKNTFELDPAKQAFQALTTLDSSRARNTNVQDYQYVLLNKNVISFPKTEETFAIDNYTPKASFESKNVCTDKSKLNTEKPNMVTTAFGINLHKTRTFNWISCGYFDEYVWLRKQGETSWTSKFRSYLPIQSVKVTNVTESTIASGYQTVLEIELTTSHATRGENLLDYNIVTNTFHTKICNAIFSYNTETNRYTTTVTSTSQLGLNVNDTLYLHQYNDDTYIANTYPAKRFYSADVINNIYARIYRTFPGANIKYTSHKCIVDIIEDNAPTEKTVWEYVVGRSDINGNPDKNHTSDIQTFTLYPTSYTPQIYQTTDQQGFHWIEYQAWGAAANELNKTITEDCTNNNIIPILMNTGDMTQNGTRINEWYDYYNAGHCLFDHLEQMYVVGNNDLCDTDPEILGTGDDNGKSNGFYFHVFYCYEIDTNNIPLINNDNTIKYIPSLYYFGNIGNENQVRPYRFVMVNSEITAVNCKNWFQQLKNNKTVNVYTGWTISTGNMVDDCEYDDSFTTVYTMIYNMLNNPTDPAGNSINSKDIIVACHEMPFTVITNSNLGNISGGYSSPAKQNIDRSLNGSATAALVGSHTNKLNYNDIKSNYWFSRLLEYFNIVLCIGGHKHTYMCTNPLRELYYYTVNGVAKNSLDDGKMPMESTLQNDTVSFTVKLKATSTDSTGTHYLLDQSTTVNNTEVTFTTNKFPLMQTTEQNGILATSAVYYPIYGVNQLTGGITYLMCQATGYKLKSNKELPAQEQKFALVIPKTNYTTSNLSDNKPNSNQQYPMFIVIKFGYTDDKIDAYLYRIENIMIGTTLFSQISYNTNKASYKYLGTTATDTNATDIFGTWKSTLTPIVSL